MGFPELEREELIVEGKSYDLVPRMWGEYLKDHPQEKVDPYNGHYPYSTMYRSDSCSWKVEDNKIYLTQDPYAAYRKESPYSFPMMATWFTGQIIVDGCFKTENPDSPLVNFIDVHEGVIVNVETITVEEQRQRIREGMLKNSPGLWESFLSLFKSN